MPKYEDLNVVNFVNSLLIQMSGVLNKMDTDYDKVLIPYERGLTRFIDSGDNPREYVSTIRDMRQALTEMMRITLGRPSEEMWELLPEFIRELKLDEHDRIVLRHISNFANEYLSTSGGIVAEPPKRSDVQGFIFSTSLFIRMAAQRCD